MLACEPTLLAHASLATADVALAAGLLAFWVHYRSGRSHGWWGRVGIPTAWFAVAVLTKASALVFGVFGMALLEIEVLLRERGDGIRWSDRLRARCAAFFGVPLRRMCQVVWLGLVLVFVFCGSDWKASPSFVKWAQGLPDGAWGDGMRWGSQHLCIFSNAGNALAYQIRRNLASQEVFLLGESYQRALWYYFPVALSIKLTLPLLALPVLLVGLSPRSLRNWVCAVAGALLLYSLNCRVQLGVRLLLPLVSLAVVGLAAALARAAADAPAGWRRFSLRAVALAVPLWMVWAAWSAWPNGLSYVNELWGGPAEGYKLVSDSNYDWGQGLKELLAWQQHSGVETLDVIYFGMDPRVQRPPFHLLNVGAWASPGPEALRADARGPYVAVGTSFAYSTFQNVPRLRPLLEWFHQTAPAARTSTFLIYDLRQTDERASAAR
jgi:hypothetical protein